MRRVWGINLGDAHKPGAEHEGVVLEGPGMCEGAGDARVIDAHYGLRAAKGPEWHPAAEVLAKGDHVGLDVEEALQAPGCQSGGHDLVEDEQGSMLYGKRG